MNRNLLVIELWGLGDLALSVPLLNAAVHTYNVTLLAKPSALELRDRFFPGVEVIPWTAPWTAFRGKYHIWRWNFSEIMRIIRKLRNRFDFAISARHDPRDHFLMWLTGANHRLGFPRLGSGIFLTRPIPGFTPRTHRYEHWRRLAQELGLDVPLPQQRRLPPRPPDGYILIHTGAAQPTRIWPLERYRVIVERLIRLNQRVLVVCEQNQLEWWIGTGLPMVTSPKSLTELVNLLEGARLFVGNDSGVGHLAALMGIPTCTIFGPQLPETFLPIHPKAVWIEGKPCRYKPCFDYCKLKAPKCILDISVEEVWEVVRKFVDSQ